MSASGAHASPEAKDCDSLVAGSPDSQDRENEEEVGLVVF